MPQKFSAGSSDLHLVRYSHIFASAVREVLEVRTLRETTPLPITVSQFHLLKLMCMDGSHRMQEIAGFLGVSPPATTKNVDKLERLGLVVRGASPLDRRATLLSVSERGRRLVQDHEARKRERLGVVTSEFTRRELRILSDLLQRFALSLLRLEKPEHGPCLRCAACLAGRCAISRVRGGCPYASLRRADDAAVEVS